MSTSSIWGGNFGILTEFTLLLVGSIGIVILVCFLSTGFKGCEHKTRGLFTSERVQDRYYL